MLQNPSTKTVQRLLFAGIIGSLLMFTGDMLLYFDPGHAEMTPESIVTIMRKLDPHRVMAGGAIGPFATLLYCFGYLGIANLVRPEHPFVKAALFLIFTVGALYGGAAYHSHFPTMTFAPGEGKMGVIPLVDEYIDYLGYAAFGLWAVASLVFHYAVLTGKTYCRKRAALFAPLPMALLVIPLVYLPAPFLIVIAGGWYCLMMTIFFAACLIEASRRPGIQ